MNLLVEYANKIGLAHFVHFAGSHLDVRKFYYTADMFTLTSNSETFSLSALEAMAFCLPCSLTSVGGATEMMIEGITGQLSMPENPMSIAHSWYKILTSNINGNRIRQHVVDNFNATKMLQQYIYLVGES